jgi:uncharacterized protein
VSIWARPAIALRPSQLNRLVFQRFRVFRISRFGACIVPLILDTFNVLHTVGILPPDLAGLDVPGLAELMLRSRYRSERVTFVCDGLPPGPPADLPPPGPLLLAERSDQFFVRYAGRSATADDLIRDIVAASTAPRRLVVVSSDHAVQRHARKRRCAVLSSEEFLQQLADDAHLADRSPSGPKPHRPSPSLMSREQVEKWMEVFDVDERAIAQDVETQEPIADSSAPHLPSSPPPQPPSQAVTERSEAPGPLQAAPRDSTPASSGPIPADLVAQAEALWQQGGHSNILKNVGMSPPDFGGEHPSPGLTNDGRRDNDPDHARHPQASPPPASPQPTQPPSPSPPPSPTSQSSDSSDFASLDMNAILPADGRTQPLRKRKRAEHQRPPPREAK